MDEELGISKDGMSKLQFRHRRIREKTLFFLYHNNNIPKDLHSFDNPFSKKGREKLAEQGCCVAVVAGNAAARRRW